ncbi:MAG: hypothetical protein Kow0062_07910 [Acidobacteriota bacterium]|nr:MAG: carboxypeptidase regulatory-like domain-containing protein [Acidobacteriota bacterium]
MSLSFRLAAALAALALVAAPICAQPAGATTPGALRGVLLDAEGLPAEAHQVGARSAAGDLFLSPPTGPDGSFALTGLPPGEYRLVAFGPDGTEYPLAPASVEVGAGQAVRLELRLAGAAGPPGRTAEGVGRVRSQTRGGGPSFWSTRTGRLVLIGGGVVAAALLYSATDDDEAPAPSPATP